VLTDAKNKGAKFSVKGFDTLIRRSRGDDALTTCVGLGPDLPPQLFDRLLTAASAKVRATLEAEREFAKSDIDRVVDEVTSRIETVVATQPLSYAAAQVLVESIHRAGLLTAGKLQEFASNGRFEETVAALSLMSNLPTAAIEQDMRDTNSQSLIVLARAIGLSWETTRSIMTLVAKRYRHSLNSVEGAMPAFHRLRQSTAQQILDFHRACHRAPRAGTSHPEVRRSSTLPGRIVTREYGLGQKCLRFRFQSRATPSARVPKTEKTRGLRSRL
jgi:Uncharacterised protein conserved in bacteria (DUF2336)